MIEKEEKWLLEKVWENLREIQVRFPPGARADMTDEELQRAFEDWDAKKANAEYRTQQVNQWHAEWKAYQFKIDTGEKPCHGSIR
jgi:hypothetical protein